LPRFFSQGQRTERISSPSKGEKEVRTHFPGLFTETRSPGPTEKEREEKRKRGRGKKNVRSSLFPKGWKRSQGKRREKEGEGNSATDPETGEEKKEEKKKKKRPHP